MRYAITLQQSNGRSSAQATLITNNKCNRTRNIGIGDSLLDALSQACNMPRLELTTFEDELELCRSMLRGKSVICETVGTRLRVLSLEH